ncbi:MAG TPA: hypothetical protein VM901_08775 [Bdellovibrionota bacterium]|jgi:hypothetical protein|nr:hypothetical protein [Bdellovibrionota bacterium]
MMKRILLSGLVFAAQTSFASDPSTMLEARFAEYFPKEIAEYLLKYRVCQHFAGEEAYDAKRGQEIAAQSKKHCIDFKKARAEIRTKIKDAKKLEMMDLTIKEIDAGESLHYSFVWDDPKKQSPALNNHFESEARGVLQNVAAQMKDYIAAEKSGDRKKIESARYGLSVQFKYFQEVQTELERLTSATKTSIEALGADKAFLNAALRSEVENLIGYIQTSKTQMKQYKDPEMQKTYAGHLSGYRDSLMKLKQRYADALAPELLRRAEAALQSP